MRHLVVALLTAFAAPTFSDEAASFFDDSAVQEIRLTFEDPNWYNLLYAGHANDEDDPYFPAQFTSGDVTLNTIGVRFKGNSSFQINTVKKSIKLDFNEYDDDQTFLGLKKLNLNNGAKDPTLLREKLFLDFAGQFVPAIRAVHTRVYINGEFWGLYTAVEQVDKTFARSRFGDEEDGNLYKAQSSDDANPNSDFGSDLTWLGESQAAYEERYQLKTNEEGNDYSDLIAAVYILNSTASADLPSQLEPIFDVPVALKILALNSLFVNFDAYITSAHNYYLYDRDDTGRLTMLLWDTNESFGRFTMGLSRGDDPLTLDPFWLPENMVGDVEGYPLAENLWAVDSYRSRYQDALALMLANGFDEVTMGERIQELADLIRDDVYSDGNKQYSNSDFERNLTESVFEQGPMREPIYGLQSFVRERAAYLTAMFEAPAEPEVLMINEILAANDTILADDHGEFDDWIELYYRTDGPVSLTGYTLTDDLMEPARYFFPDLTVDGEGYILIWADNDEEQGYDHAGFELSASEGEAVGLFDPSGNPVDSLTFEPQWPDASLIRRPEEADSWSLTATPTPGTANNLVDVLPGCTDSASSNYDPSANVDDGSCTYEPMSISIFINEILAANDTILADDHGEFDDWIELYYKTDGPVSLTGYTLTDDLTEPDKYAFADLTVEGEGYILIWADNDEEQGYDHAGFKLSASEGETVGLFDPNGYLVDSLTFGPQEADVSYGREYDGADSWVGFGEPTPGISNGVAPDDPRFLRGDSNDDSMLDLSDAITILIYLFGEATTPSCLKAADANDDGDVNLADVIAVLDHLFGEAGPLPEPFGECGGDPTSDELGCSSYSSCEQ